MPEIDVITDTHTHTNELRAVSFEFEYPHGSAELTIHIDGPRAQDREVGSRAELIRLEIEQVINALQQITASSENIRIAERRK